MPGKTYGVVLIFLWVVETIWSIEPNKSIQALVASFNLFFREINNHHHDKKKTYDKIGPAYLSRTAISTSGPNYLSPQVNCIER